MAFSLKDVTHEARHLPPRIILLGTPKVGKTTFAASAPGAILIPVKGEEGADDMTCAKFPTAHTLDDVMAALGTLATEPHEFQFVVIDSATALERLVWEATCKAEQWPNIEKPGYGKGYVCALSQWQKIMEALDWLRNNRGMGVILIGHVKSKVYNDPLLEPYDAFMWDIKDNAASAFIKWADCVLFARPRQFVKQVGDGLKTETHAIGGGERCLFTQERPAHPGGGRGVYGRLPYELPLNFDAWAGAVAAEMAKG
jgi:hypothetical protein